MWLLNALTYRLQYFNSPRDDQLTEFGGYTILSHTWGEEEVLFHDMKPTSTKAELAAKLSQKAGWKKIEYICQQTIKDQLMWTWIDTCCIDKSSSAELSEAINSMFAWYRDAAVCHVYMSDAYAADDVASPSSWAKSRWWRRGWYIVSPAERSDIIRNALMTI